VQKGESFAFETTLSGLHYLVRIRQWQEQGYHVSLFSFTCRMWRRPSHGWQSE
jgi:predicted ABC-type ATPase